MCVDKQPIGILPICLLEANKRNVLELRLLFNITYHKMLVRVCVC